VNWITGARDRAGSPQDRMVAAQTEELFRWLKADEAGKK